MVHVVTLFSPEAVFKGEDGKGPTQDHCEFPWVFSGTTEKEGSFPETGTKEEKEVRGAKATTREGTLE